MKTTLKIITLFFSLIFCASIFAANEPPPLAMLRSTANTLISELNRHQGNLKGNDTLMHSIIRRIILPHFDIVSMSQAVVGRTYWQSATPVVQKEFVREFTTYAIRTYSGALESYNGQQVKFYPIRGYNNSRNQVQVSSDVLQANGPAIAVSYRLYNRGGNWVVYDFNVEGVSFTQNYRSQFSSPLRRGGLAGLVQDIKSHNQGGRS